MHTPTLRWPRLAAGLLCVSALWLASCASDDRPRRGALPKPPKPVAGEAAYLGGQLVATIRVGLEFQRPEGGGDGAGRDGREAGGHRGGGGMNFGGGAGPMRFGGGCGPGGPGGGRGEGPPRDLDGGGERGPRVMPASGLPLMIHLQLRNTGQTPVDVAVRDFVSPLGNFVVQPATLTVPAGEAAEFSPMTSFVQGDLPDELPVTLALRTAHGTEKQVIVLRPVAPAATPPSGSQGPESRPTDK